MSENKCQEGELGSESQSVRVRLGLGAVRRCQGAHLFLLLARDLLSSYHLYHQVRSGVVGSRVAEMIPLSESI